MRAADLALAVFALALAGASTGCGTGSRNARTTTQAAATAGEVAATSAAGEERTAPPADGVSVSALRFSQPDSIGREGIRKRLYRPLPGIDPSLDPDSARRFLEDHTRPKPPQAVDVRQHPEDFVVGQILQERRPARPVLPYPGAGVALQMGPVVGCTGVKVESLTCSSLNLVGNGAAPQAACVLVTGVESLSGIEFGIEYSPAVNVLGWVSCSDMQIPAPTWPSSGSWIAVTTGAARSSGPDGIVLVGCLLIGAGSTGDLWITGAQRGTVNIVPGDSSSGEWSIPAPCGLGRVRIGGPSGEAPYNPCRKCSEE